LRCKYYLQGRLTKKDKNTTYSAIAFSLSTIYNKNTLELTNQKIRKRRRILAIMKKITVFTTSSCAYCGMVKKWLDNKGISYDVVNLDEQPEMQKQVFEKSGALTVPITLVENDDSSEEVVVGFNLARLAAVV
jgi:glutaredoxin 3